MKLVFILACLGLICVAGAINTVCPPRPSMSVLTDPIVPEDCNDCDQLKDVDTDFWEKCGQFMDELILDKIMADCKRITDTKKKVQIDWFWNNLRLTCSVKTKLPPFKKTDCVCDPCDELAKIDSEFMTVCADYMTECDVIERLCMCRQVKDDYEQLWEFYKDLRADCYALTGVNITVPICDCDVCWLLFDEDSDFMKKCGGDMDPLMLKKLFHTCEKVMCDPLELGYFKMNLELMCEKKQKEAFDFPECVCEECWLIFQTESSFMKKCGSAMSPLMRMELMKSCYANMDSLDHFMTFLDNLELVCHKKNGEYFDKEWCYCIHCLLLEDPYYQNISSPIWEECTGLKSESERQTMRHECLAALENHDDFEVFKTDLLEYCHTKTGGNWYEFPLCDKCTRTDLCVEFVIDSSGSINDAELAQELQFVKNVIAAFGSNIGPGKTQIGLIRFSNYAETSISLCDFATQVDIENMINDMQTNRFQSMTNTPDGLDHMTDDISQCCSGDAKTKFGIVLTDGLHNRGNLTAALENIPTDVKMIAIGFGSMVSLTELEDIAGGDASYALNVDDASELATLITELLGYLGCH